MVGGLPRDPCTANTHLKLSIQVGVGTAASTDELGLRIQAIWNFLPQAGVQKLFDFMPRRTAAHISVRGGYYKC